MNGMSLVEAIVTFDWWELHLIICLSQLAVSWFTLFTLFFFCSKDKMVAICLFSIIDPLTFAVQRSTNLMPWSTLKGHWLFRSSWSVYLQWFNRQHGSQAFFIPWFCCSEVNHLDRLLKRALIVWLHILILVAKASTGDMYISDYPLCRSTTITSQHKWSNQLMLIMLIWHLFSANRLINKKMCKMFIIQDIL